MLLVDLAAIRNCIQQFLEVLWLILHHDKYVLNWFDFTVGNLCHFTFETIFVIDKRFDWHNDFDESGCVAVTFFLRFEELKDV